MGVLRPEKEPGPLPLPVLIVTPKEPTQLLVGPLHLPAGLKPISGCKADPQLLLEGSPYPLRELRATVGDDVLQKAIVPEDLLEQCLRMSKVCVR